ncbi:baseplate J/gp47 family protein [Pseudomonas sp. 5P_3.1_Bac2]|uniref:baseplate assembly protein n=1 Tax=Pseudomonas sp. 5P_3.1_Bac2 TaxID=2971617 RepID=UPI0021C7DBB4|nr:baseplate J/gp47 family protein [Pseudomonas sp. 5P_3.1_Bac2]MCU1718677.1 baseplate J/gp47 family protein [Pseudomonas sp. 5P_3.1_Bac2]
MRVLPAPEFVKVDPAAIEADLVARYEAKSGKTLYPAQIERLFIDQLAYAQSLALLAIQHAGEQLLVRYSSAPILDYLGELVGTARLPAQPARCLLQFSLSAPSSQSQRIPAGTQVSSQDGRLSFISDADVVLAPGQVQGQSWATCLTAGVQGNGWAVGQISVLSAAPVSGLQASNITVSADGADDETDERYRERIILAPEAYSNAGSRGAYRYHALSVHPSIIDVAVLGPDDGQQDGHVALLPLTRTGLPSADLLNQVQAYLSAEKRRPLCDTVHTQAPPEVAFNIEANLSFYANADRDQALAQAQAAAEAWAAERRAGLGRDIVPEQLIATLQVPGVYRAALSQPLLTEVPAHAWANCHSIQLRDAGVVDG